MGPEVGSMPRKQASSNAQIKLPKASEDATNYGLAMVDFARSRGRHGESDQSDYLCNLILDGTKGGKRLTSS